MILLDEIVNSWPGVVERAISAAVIIFTLIWNSRRQRLKVVEAVEQGTTAVTKATTEQTDAIGPAIAQVHDVVNGQRAALLREIAALKAQVVGLGGIPATPE